ncbi:MAG: amidohydrolase family protein [Gemmatimonadetes bacterium]|nr:amidohydrolase family protein [Gemmatimonadota bacterium]MYG83743.1 amidohydrolase family protein [Gemmatimonadota bacterium]MYJ90402.1 amidohydrolase family protein [Gemmatimonadota bacterium]
MSSLNFSPRVPVIDANVCVGNHHTGPSPCQSPAQLLDEMDFHGVERAVIYHAQGEQISPTDGNEYLEDWLDEDGRLVPQWMVAPVETSMKQIAELHGRGRVRSARLHDCQSAGLPFLPWGYDELLTLLSDAGIPLWIPLMDVEADHLVTTLKAYPDLHTVLVGAHYTHALVVRGLLEASPRAVLELSRYEPIGEVEALVKRFGAERFVYGSWYPRYAMGPILFYLHHTRMGVDELARVCAGNVERLLGLTEGS